MNWIEVKRRRKAVLDEAAIDGSEIDVRPIHADGGLVIVATVPDLTGRSDALKIIARHFPGTPVNFEP